MNHLNYKSKPVTSSHAKDKVRTNKQIKGRVNMKMMKNNRKEQRRHNIKE